MREIRYIWAINEAIKEEMERDENVVLIGEDVGVPGGSFGATRGLYDLFGPERVFDTPISEAAITGLAAGAAACGLRPILEIMFMDFMTVCMDGIVNQIAKMRYMFGSQYRVPIVIRTPAGAGLNAGPQHSQSLEAWFAHVPGLKVVMPGTPYDVKGLIKAAVRDDNPVIVVEHKALHAMKGEIPEEEYLVPIGKARVKKEGSDVTVVAVSKMVHEALKAAESLAQEGIGVEVIDLLTVSPWDRERVFSSVGKTHRLVVAHEAVKKFGIGAEISAEVSEKILDELDAPIMRVGAPYVPVPFSLEKVYLPNSGDIIAAVKKTLERTF
ncbi:MAG: alpha-ketoacid dehydrogenase subunit beta [Deltaproteobacteria bacterium]|nr:alpha-ketoacid dehydrogenase subunit beta [Deltaproteobacteria bacterium]MBW2110095.1 alpha-ketoacid dehydrogenase subunit beta [Deltaproteobacteria bacterium]